MKYIPLLVICIIIGVFLGESFDIETYQQYHESNYSIKKQTTPLKQDFIEDVDIVYSPNKEKWLLEIIQSAKNEIKVATYMFTVPSLMEELLEAKKRGVDVEIILEKNPYNATKINEEAIQFFRNNNIDFYETENKKFSFMHAKYIIIDDTWIISTANWTRSSFSSNREFFILGQDSGIHKILLQIFESDFGGVNMLFSQDPRLLIGPTNARQVLIEFITSAKKNIQIYMPSITDTEIILTVQKSCKDGKIVSILLNDNKENREKSNEISQNGCPKIRLMKNPSLHAKAIITDNERYFVGSFNFTENSLENNREIGIFIKGESIGEIVNIFWQDWGKSVAF